MTGRMPNMGPRRVCWYAEVRTQSRLLPSRTYEYCKIPRTTIDPGPERRVRDRWHNNRYHFPKRIQALKWLAVSMRLGHVPTRPADGCGPLYLTVEALEAMHTAKMLVSCAMWVRQVQVEHNNRY